jgi:hypothetical protein
MLRINQQLGVEMHHQNLILDGRADLIFNPIFLQNRQDMPLSDIRPGQFIRLNKQPHFQHL